MYRCTRIFCVSLFCTSIAWSAIAADSAGTKPEGTKLDLTYVPADAVAAAIVHPQRVIQSPQFAIWPTEIISAGGKKELGFDPLEIDFALGVAGMPQMPNAPQQQMQRGGPQPRYAVLLHFTKAQDTNRVLALVVKDGQDGLINQKKARISADPTQPSATVVDDRTVILGPEQSLQWILTANTADSPLRKQMALANDSPDASIFITLEPLRPFVIPGLAMAAMRMPPQFQELVKLPNLVDSIEVRLLNFTVPGSSIELDLISKDAQSAEELQQVVTRGLENGKAAVIAQMTEQAQRQPEEREMNDAMLHYLNRMGDMVVKSLEPKQAANHVLIRNELQGGGAEVGIAVALLLPAVQAAREAANRNVSQNNLKQIALCMLNYEDQHKNLPPRAFFDKDGKPLLSWRVMMLPDMDESNLFQQFHFDEPWDSEHNKTLIEKMPDTYKDPRFNLPPGMTMYQAVVGKGCVFEGPDKGIKLRQITDGTSKTAGVVAVSPDKAVPWTKPEDWEFDPKHPLRDLENPSAGGIIQLMFIDGHIEGVRGTINPDVLKAVFTRNGGEVVNLP